VRKSVAKKPRHAPIAKISGKMARALGEYSRKKQRWIKGKPCAVKPHLSATDIHHMKGRVGYADQWARENGITLLLDERFWLPVSRAGHNQIETNTEWARKMGYSMSRSEIVK
jgi:hypothetical protein